MPLDPSIPLQAQTPAPVNPLTTIGQFAQTQNAMNANQLFSQQMQDRQTIGQAYQSATDPTTGQVDYNKLTGALAGSGGGALVPGAIQAAQEQQGRQLGISGAQLDQATKRLAYINNVTGSLLAKPGGATPADVTSALVDGMTNGILSKQDVMGQIQSLPNDPAQLQTWLQQHQLNALDQGQKLAAIYGTPQMVNTGGSTVPVAVSPVTGVRQIGGPIQNTLSPGESAARIPTFANGQPGSVPQSSVVTPTGQPMPDAGAGAGYTGRFPAAQATGAPAAAPPAPAAPAGFVASGPKLGAATAADATAKASADQGVQLQQTADQVPARKAALGNLESDLQNFTSGPGADWTKVGKSAVNKYNPFFDTFSPQSIASQEAFTKQATQLATAQMATLGGAGTDSKLDAAMHTNPSDVLSKLGNQQIIGLLKGNEDAIAVKNQEWQKYLQTPGASPQDYGAFSTQFNKSYDPRVFQSAYMAPAQRQDMVKSMSPAEQTAFVGSLRTAIGKGWISPTSWSAPDAAQ